MLEPSAATIAAIVTNDAEMSPVPRPVSPWPAVIRLFRAELTRTSPTPLQQQANMLELADIKYWYCVSAADNQ